jgi:DNA-binding winged helix-turn-helix (wHTH) protein
MVLRFGACQFDPVSGDVRRDGRLVRLRPQPAAVLTYLVNRRGVVVSRDELRQHLWGASVHVGFDLGLNSCVKQIRRALGDSARSPVYIETLTRRGYRFLPSVDRADEDAERPAQQIVRRTGREVATTGGWPASPRISRPAAVLQERPN